MNTTQQQIIELLRSTHRKGIENVINWLDSEPSFFEVPASTTNHDNFRHGLAIHSLAVYNEALALWEQCPDDFKKTYPIDSLVIATLLHDVCKKDVYYIGEDGLSHSIKENRDKGHGLRSVQLLEEQGLELTEDEKQAIWWHMGKYEVSRPQYTELYEASIRKGCFSELCHKADSTAARKGKIVKPEKAAKPEFSVWDGSSATSRSDYQAVIFGSSYFAIDHPQGEIEQLVSYLEQHDVKVGIVTTDLKPRFTKWLPKLPIKVDCFIGGGDVKAGRFKFHKKPEPQPFEVCTARMGRYTNEVLSVCVRDVDVIGSKAAGIDWICRPTPGQIIALLSKSPAPAPLPKRDLKGPIPTTGIMGAICGDVIGAPYESRSMRTKKTDFELFTRKARASDDTTLTMAIAEWLMSDRSEESLRRKLVIYGKSYPRAGWGHNFKDWLASSDHPKREAGSNGSAMRVSPVGYAARSLEECLSLAQQQAKLTHNTPEGIHGAQAIAAAIYLARTGKSKAEVKTYIEQQFGYDLDQSIEQIRSTYNLKEKFTCACNKCAAEAIICWLNAYNYEQTIRYAISLGGDSDTLAAMAGGIASATPGMEIPEEIATFCYNHLSDEFKRVLLEFEGYLETLTR